MRLLVGATLSTEAASWAIALDFPINSLDWYDAAVVCKHIANPHRTSQGSSAIGQSTAA
jgi:hypothetical protein